MNYIICGNSVKNIEVTAESLEEILVTLRDCEVLAHSSLQQIALSYGEDLLETANTLPGTRYLNPIKYFI